MAQGSYHFQVYFKTDSPIAHEQVMGAMMLTVVRSDSEEPTEAEADLPQEREEPEAEEEPREERGSAPEREERSSSRRDRDSESRSSEQQADEPERETVRERAAELRCSHERRDCSGCRDAAARRRCMTGE